MPRDDEYPIQGAGACMILVSHLGDRIVGTQDADERRGKERRDRQTDRQKSE